MIGCGLPQISPVIRFNCYEAEPTIGQFFSILKNTAPNKGGHQATIGGSSKTKESNRQGDQIIITSSFNWSNEANLHDRENLVVLNRQTWDAAYEQNFQEIWNVSA